MHIGIGTGIGKGGGGGVPRQLILLTDSAGNVLTDPSGYVIAYIQQEAA